MTGSEDGRFTWREGDVRLQTGRVEVAHPAVQAEWCGHPQHPHVWRVVNIDSADGPAYRRTCGRCGTVEVRVPGKPWRAV